MLNITTTAPHPEPSPPQQKTSTTIPHTDLNDSHPPSQLINDHSFTELQDKTTSTFKAFTPLLNTSHKFCLINERDNG
jgi:hypothetical protein